MFLLRNAVPEDINDIFELAQLANFINLPADRNELTDIIKSSLESFRAPKNPLWKNHYLFVVEDLKERKVIGTSLIHAQHGTKLSPHYFLKVSKEDRFSKTLNTGMVHGTLKLGLEMDGPTEIGALVLHPSYRAHAQKIGKQLSFVRFLYMSLYPERFKKEVHSELLPPFDQEGNSPLWEAIGRKFTNMDYREADKLSQENKEFILSLFPLKLIYITLLPIEARNSVGNVGQETLPVKKMLEQVGFTYIQEVDPFDGGPHYRCKLSEIKPIKEKKEGTLLISDKNKEVDKGDDYLVNLPSQKYLFAAMKIKNEQEKREVSIDSSLAKDLMLNQEEKKVTLIPLS